MKIYKPLKSKPKRKPAPIPAPTPAPIPAPTPANTPQNTPAPTPQNTLTDEELEMFRNQQRKLEEIEKAYELKLAKAKQEYNENLDRVEEKLIIIEKNAKKKKKKKKMDVWNRLHKGETSQKKD